jgi:hypothetical protein
MGCRFVTWVYCECAVGCLMYKIMEMIWVVGFNMDRLGMFMRL